MQQEHRMYIETVNGENMTINPILFEFFHWQNETKSINTCLLWPSNNIETSGRLIHI